MTTASTVKRRYTDPALYSPRLAQQAPVPTTGLSTEVYDTFVAQMPSLSGRTAFVTGANTGLGYHAARALAARGARVVLLCRDVHKADTAKREMLADDATLAIETEHLDLSSLAQVRECAAELRARFAKCDVLLLNAGVMGVQHTLTEDGHDVQLQANHLGHFLLVPELLPSSRGYDVDAHALLALAAVQALCRDAAASASVLTHTLDCALRTQVATVSSAIA